MSDQPLSRRYFMQLGAAGAASAIASGAAAQDRRLDLPNRAIGRPAPQLGGPAELPDAEKVGIAVVGLGKLALGEVLPAFGQCRAAKLAAVVSGDPAKARRVAAQAGLPDDAIYSYESYDRMAQDRRIDVVYIILPNSLHADYTVRAFKAGKHVLCEKPMATTEADCRRMIAAAEAADRKLMIAYRCFFEPANLEAMRVMRSGTLGKIRSFSSDNGRPSSLSDPADQWRLDGPLSGGGALTDIGIYGINGARYLLGEEPVEVRAWAYTDKSDPRFAETEDAIHWQFRMASGVIVNGSTSFSYASTSRLQAVGEKGRLVMDPATNYRGIQLAVHEGGVERRPQTPAIDQFAREMDEMAMVVRRNRPIAATGEEGMQDVRLMLAILESVRQGGAAVRTDWGYKRAVDPVELADRKA
ncbi:Gfo/Idh/MocA family protein [Sphingomonas baiyangensis]|uniref:Gfo/Idh/MocA family oxidoreductase n=1 Tax=Sphingomonas baiyangensis TaxID=2572576 RepID=A0A4V5PWZ0_9SPHN|nr:Gfo/Idh/MocA family oxidoreductase [Sphingomonas baiyangensis]TKD53278.1 Gfo/Idh/MocA family oxidoreductase [Sphingomonas baiyangensis]